MATLHVPVPVPETVPQSSLVMPPAAAPRAPSPRRCARLSPQRLATVTAYVDDHVAERISVRDLADAVHISPFHFARMFKETVGTPPHAYITRVRIERAKRLLAETQIPLVEVAARVGFQTQAHFTGVFHRFVGTTPRVYRRNASGSPGAA